MSTEDFGMKRFSDYSEEQEAELTRLRAEVESVRQQLTISRNQTKDAFERVAQEHNGRVKAEAENETLRKQIDRAMEKVDWRVS